MFRLWGKEFKENRLLRDTVICDETTDTRTHKIFNALDAICYEFEASLSGLTQRSPTSNGTQKLGFIRITL